MLKLPSRARVHPQYKKRIMSEYPGQVLSPDFTSPDATANSARPFHVSNIRLQARSGTDTFTVSRMRRTAPTWDRQYNRFTWTRYGFSKKLATTEDAESGWVEIPWPREDVTPPGAPGAF